LSPQKPGSLIHCRDLGVPRETHLMVGVVLGVGGPRSRLKWLCTGLWAGGTSGLRAGSFREKSETALCTAEEQEEGEPSPRGSGALTDHVSPCKPPSQPQHVLFVVFLFCGAGDGIQGTAHARQGFYTEPHS
jgi:hypothetical protein